MLVNLGEEMIDISPFIQFHINKNESIGDSDIVNLDFNKLEPKILDSKIYRNEVYWIKIQLQLVEPQAKDYYISFNHPYATYYFFEEDSNLTQNFGYFDSVDHTLSPFFPVQLVKVPGKEGVQTLYFRLSSKDYFSGQHRLQIDLDRKIMNQHSIDIYMRQHMWDIALVIGILFAIFFYHIIIFLSNSQYIFLYLSLSALHYIYIILHLNGILGIWFGLNPGKLYYGLGDSAIYMSALIFIPLTTEYLKIKNYSKSLYRLLRYTLVIFLIYWIFDIFLQLLQENYFESNSLQVKNLIIMIYISFVNICGFYCGVHTLRQGEKNALTYLIGIGIILIGGFINIMLPRIDSLTFEYPDDLHTAIGFLVLSFGLAKQFKTLQEERSEAEKQKSHADQLRKIEVQEKEKLKE
ncbi:MAG: 7TM-DISM domain-containing protein, partial [Saprospiraceae bacterium]|nr:7TM-DISM domain-containing protein [Saprospiraceae bacterium]